jgi:ATP-dependent Clp protease adaptor protein ClpS
MPKTSPKPAVKPSVKPEFSTPTRKSTSAPPDLTPLFHVVLLNDDDHTYDYVVEMLATIFCVSPAAAFHHAVEVDTTGRTIVMTCEREQAEFGRDQIHKYGADPRMAKSQGSMSAIIEPAGQSR